MIRKVLPFVVLLVVVVAAAVVLLGARNAEDHYRVRAIFDNAGFVIPGEDVKVAGVKVGKIESVDVTPDFKAAVVLQIDEPGYQDFRRDASCIVRPQNLIGERFVECKPTQQRAAGTNPPPELSQIDRGPGALWVAERGSVGLQSTKRSPIRFCGRTMQLASLRKSA